MKILLCVFMVSSVYIGNLYAQTEELTITTFYPSPYGVYQVLKFEPSNSVGSAGDGCDAIQEGELQYNANDNTLLLCDGSREWVELGGSEGSYYWEPDGGGIVNVRSTDVRVTGALNVGGNMNSASVTTGPVTASTVNADTVTANTVNAGTVNGNTGIFNTLSAGTLAVAGNITAGGTISAGPCDLAEPFPAATGVSAGDVVRIDAEKVNHIVKTIVPYDSSVAGIISTTPGMALGKDKKTAQSQFLALAGTVPCKVTTANGPIKPGDLLTTSSKPGYAMKFTLIDYSGAENFQQLKTMMKENEQRKLSIIGRALEPLGEGDGKISVLVAQ